MPLSALMMTILEQAKEPLLCLHGAGYFSEEEWIHLDLIMNKKYLWTLGPDNRSQIPRSAYYSAKKVDRRMQDKIVLPASDSDGDKNSSSPEETSICTSLEPLSDDIETQAPSMDTPWELSPAMASPAPSQPNLLQPNLPKLSMIGGLSSGYTLSQIEESRGLSNSFANSLVKEPSSDLLPEFLQSNLKALPGSPFGRHKSVSSWASEVYNSPQLKSDVRPASQTSAFSSEPHELPPRAPSRPPIEFTENNLYGDVNAFETSNAAEWDDIPLIQQKKHTRQEFSNLIEENFDKASQALSKSFFYSTQDADYENADYIIQSNRDNKKPSVNGIMSTSTTLPPIAPIGAPTAPANIPPAPPRPEMRYTQRTATIPRSLRRRDLKDSKESKDRSYIPPAPKTKTCWFWAESVGGCRYRPEECLNLHVKPEPGSLPNYPLKDGKPTWGSLADATPIEIPAGKRPKSCWFWATKGVCEKGDSCDYVHGWVLGGVAPRPKNFDYGARIRNKVFDVEDEEDGDSSRGEGIEINEKDVGDKAPPQAVNIDPSFIASRIHAPDWFASTA